MNSTLPDLLEDRCLLEADAQAVVDRLLSGQPLDPAIAARVRERSERATEEMRRKFGTVDMAVNLLHRSREDE